MTKADHEKTETKLPSKIRKFWYGVSWVALWPVIVLIPAIGAFIAAWGLVYGVFKLMENPNQAIYAVELAMLIGTTGLVGALLGVKFFLRGRKRQFFRTSSTILGVYIWLGVLFAGCIMASLTQRPDAIKPPVSQDQQLMAILESVGGNKDLMKDVSISYVDGYKDNKRAGEYQYVLDNDGKFSYGSITVKRGQDPAYEKVVVAHEYLHHMWESQLDDQAKHALTSQLITLYGKDDWMKNQRVASYSDQNILEPTELYAFYCSESSDRYLSPEILTECGKYINRSTLAFIR